MTAASLDLSPEFDLALEHDHAFVRDLYGYLAAVATALGVGMESATVDPTEPASAYLALDWRLPSHPSLDLALLWDERHGWSAAVEEQPSGQPTVVAFAGSHQVPDPATVVRFLAGLRATDQHPAGPQSAAPPPVVGRARVADTLAEYRPRPDLSLIGSC